MKTKYACGIALLCALLSVVTAFAQPAAKEIFVCPMNCDNLSYEKAGNCTVCGMALIEKTKAQANADTGDQDGYVCPPCGNSCDSAVHQKPGACPVCGMGLVAKGQAAQNLAAARPAMQQTAARSKKVAVFIFDGVQIIDYAAPYEVFGQAGFEVFTVAEKAGAITTAMGMSVNPRYTFDNHPKADVLLIPGGDAPRHQDNPKVIAWIQNKSKEAEVVLSVCNGAFFLAKAGLLDGLQATTFAPLIPGLQAAAPKAKVVWDKRFVDNGKIVTSAGLSSGIDGALHVVEKLLGRGWAEVIATNLEYDWDPESKYVRAALADKYLRNTYNFMAGYNREVLSSNGDVDHWESKWKVQTEVPAAEMLERLNNSLATTDKWIRQDSGKSNGTLKSLWKFTDLEGKSWSATASIEAVPRENNRLMVMVSMRRGTAK
ncbi:MAG: DJ-1/PfpI family protein [bacterium]